jgi:hypothetical protein
MKHCKITVFHITNTRTVVIFSFDPKWSFLCRPVRKYRIHMTDIHRIIMFGYMICNKKDLTTSISRNSFYVPADLLIPASQFICHPVDSGYISGAAVNVDQLFHLLQVQFQIHVSPPFRLQNLFQNSHLSSEIHYISYYNHLSICIIIYCIIIKFCVLCSFRIRKGNFVSIRADKCYDIILRSCGPKSDAGLSVGILLPLGPPKT